MARTLIVVNPAAGGGRAGGVWTALRDGFPTLAAEDSIVAADVAGARRRLDAELAGDVDRLIAVGGDGTAHLAVNALLAAGKANQVAFGLVPAGTGSDFARCLGLPSEPGAALAHALAAAPRTLDAIAVESAADETRYVVNIASAGLSGEVVAAIGRRPGRSRFTYLAATLSSLLRYRPVPCRVEVDGEVLYDGAFFLVAVANGRYFGKGMHVAPRAVLDDGLLDVVVAAPVPLWQLPVRLPQFLAGRHLDLPAVRWRRGRHVRLAPETGFPPLDLDGESFPANAADLRVLPGALRVLG